MNTGSSGTQTVSLSNASSAAVSIGNVSISGAGFSVSGVPAGLTLPPGQSITFTITFAPSSAGAVTGKVMISDATSSTPVNIALSGTGVASSSHSVTLTWNASTTSGVTGYRAYRGTSSAGPYSALNSSPNPQLKYVDSTVQAGTTYYYAVTAVRSDGTESVYSNAVSAAIPKP
jgi:hypothetical protein